MSAVFQPTEEAGLERVNGAVGNALGRIRLAMEVNKVTESPIETLLGVPLLIKLCVQYPGRFRWGPASMRPASPASNMVEAVAQYPFARYRMDWAVLFDGDPVVFVECDGQEYHSTPEQIANDQAKDEAARAAGIPLLRFTGSQLHRGDDQCAALVASYVCSAVPK